MRVWKGIVILGVLVAMNLLAGLVVYRWDMTDDKRYSISPQTKKLLSELEGETHIQILLEGELNAGFSRLKKATEEMVEEMSVYGKINIQDPTTTNIDGLVPTVIHERTHKGQTAQTTIYPYAIVEHQGRKRIVTLLKNQRGLSGEENLNHSIENLEYAFAEAIRSLHQREVEKIAFLEGHGELSEREVYDLTASLAQYYQVDRGTLGKETGILDGYKAIIIADPQEAFSEEDKYILDQYLMQGGRILWVVNGVRFSDEYLSSEGMTPIIAQELKIDDMLFRYGVRIKHALVQDLQCQLVPVDVSADPNQPNWQPMPWTYAPLLLTSQVSPITRNVAPVSASMASAVEIVGGEDGIRKEVLLATSSASKLTTAPAQVDLSLGGDEEAFEYAFIPVAMSLEGVFPSLYAHLLPPEDVIQHAPMRKKSEATRQIVVAAGSSIRNDWQQGQALPLGYDRYTGRQFGNKDFMVNAVLYLTDDEGWMGLRQKEFTLRLINDQRARQARIAAQVVSIVVPLLILAITGGVITLIRRKKYIRA
jgi:ABC-2 type transport system permease protein